MGLLVFIPFVIRNYLRARAAGLNGFLWSVYTVLAMFVTSIIGGMIDLFIMMAKDENIQRMIARPGADREGLVKYVQDRQTFMSSLFIVVSAVGGYLFIRHLLINRSGNTGQQPSSPQ